MPSVHRNSVPVDKTLKLNTVECLCVLDLMTSSKLYLCIAYNFGDVLLILHERPDENASNIVQ